MNFNAPRFCSSNNSNVNYWDLEDLAVAYEQIQMDGFELCKTF